MSKNVLILGGGLTGLVLADRLMSETGFSVTVLEKKDRVGGMCVTKEIDTPYGKVKYDLGPHKFATFEQDALLFFMGVVEDLIEVEKSSHVYLKGRHLSYPVKITEIFSKMPTVGMRCGIGYAGAFLKKDGDTYEKYMRKRFGDYVYGLVFEGYARKVWGDPMRLDAELARTRMVATSLIDMLIGIVKKSSSHSFDKFNYCRGGIGSLMESIASRAKKSGADIITGVSDISIDKHSASCVVNGIKMNVSFDVLISTVPIHELADMFGISTDGFRYDELKSRDLKLHYYLMDKNKIDMKDTWRFFPEQDVVFNRISRNWSDDMVPDGKICVCVETTMPTDRKSVDGAFLKYFGLNESDILASWSDGIDGAYPIYSLGFKENVQYVREVFSGRGVYCIGRHACHNYNNMDHSICEALDLVEMLREDKSVGEWNENCEGYDWRIVD
jgi:protoporphyrinogen oxidase